MSEQKLWAMAGRRNAKLWHWVIMPRTSGNLYYWTACGKSLRPVEPCIPSFPDPLLDGPACPICERKMRKEVPHA